jgi:hypothetical protein
MNQNPEARQLARERGLDIVNFWIRHQANTGDTPEEARRKLLQLLLPGSKCPPLSQPKRAHLTMGERVIDGLKEDGLSRPLMCFCRAGKPNFLLT